MLEIRNVHKTFNPGTINEKHALNGVNLKLEEGDFVTVIGGNGAGKSTMLNAVAGTWPVDDGSILIDGVDVTGLPEFKRASFLGRVFQDPMTGTTATMQIDENLALAARRGKRRGLGWGITKAEKERFHMPKPWLLSRVPASKLLRSSWAYLPTWIRSIWTTPWLMRSRRSTT
mgnify:CR=1 FL=1